jgi:hypothetical protein
MALVISVTMGGRVMRWMYPRHFQHILANNIILVTLPDSYSQMGY